MPITMSSATLPILKTMLGNLDHFLDRALAFVETRKCDPMALTQFRLAPDMLNLARQIQIACDTAKNGVARLSGVEAPRFEDTEVTIEELKARIRKTLDYLATVPAAALDGTELKDITFTVGPNTRTMQGEPYLTHWLMPNFYFHVTTAYAILRHLGVVLGKRDYLAGAGG